MVRVLDRSRCRGDTVDEGSVDACESHSTGMARVVTTWVTSLEKNGASRCRRRQSGWYQACYETYRSESTDSSGAFAACILRDTLEEEHKAWERFLVVFLPCPQLFHRLAEILLLLLRSDSFTCFALCRCYWMAWLFCTSLSRRDRCTRFDIEGLAF